MSSSNLVRITAIEEASYGQTPAAGDFVTARFVSESLSGTPSTTASTEIRSDRTAGGQVQVGLEVGGDINGELSGDPVQTQFIRAAMMQPTAVPALVVTSSIEVNAIDRRLTFAEASQFAAGDMIMLTGFTEEKNNGQAYVVSVDSVGASIKIAKETIATETGSATITRPEKLSIGTTPISHTVEKKYLDLTEKSITYTGMLVSEMMLEMAHGNIAKSKFMFMGNGYTMPVPATTDGRTITDASTDQPYNASSDIGLVIVDGQVADFCIQSLSITLNNGLSPQVCMGSLAPREYSLGAATITVSGSTYLADENWSLMLKKISQEPVSIGFTVSNMDGGMTVLLHGVQLTFPDGAAEGLDQQVSLAFSGSATATETGYFDIYTW
jgi:hypothetical protein